MAENDTQCQQGWRDRYFRLKKGKLNYYKSDKDNTVIGYIDLSECIKVTKAQGKKGYGFDIHTPGRVYNLSAQTEGEIDKWITLIDASVACIHGDKRNGSILERGTQRDSPDTHIEDSHKTIKNDKNVTLKAQLGLESSGPPKTTLNDFKLLVVLGKGAFGKVFLAEHKSSNEVYAIKSVKKDIIVQEDDVESTHTEKNVLAIGHTSPFLTSLHSCFQTREYLFYVMEFINGGDLLFHILEFGRFSENQTCFYAAEICLGLFYLHDRGIIHRDLKLDNVMLDSDGHIKIINYGLCKKGISNGVKTRTFCGTPDYIAPEVINYQPYGKSVDWWALGVLVYEMMAGLPPFDGDDEDQLFNNIMEKPVHYPRGMSEPAKKLLQGFLTKHPTRRLGCNPDTGTEDIKGQPFFRVIDWKKLADREIKPPFKPKIKGKKSVNNFDSEFTSEKCELSLVDETVIANIDEELFRGFSFTNPDLYIAS